MGILSVVWRNLTRRVRTRQPDDMVPRPERFRGVIEHETSLCTGCGACAYVCAPRAITCEEKGDSAVTWKFFAGQCSFCGLCVQYCPTHAITNRGKLPPVTGDQSLLRVAHEVPYRPCARCGRPVMPLPNAVLQQIYGRVAENAEAEQRLCDACRRKAAGRHLRDALMDPAAAFRNRGTKE